MIDFELFLRVLSQGGVSFVIVGGVATERPALAVFPVPPLLELTFPVVFT